MKKFFLVVVMISLNVLANESALVLTNDSFQLETKANTSQPIKNLVDWKFLIGQSYLNYNSDISGKGLSLAAGYIYNDQLSFGGSYTQFKTTVNLFDNDKGTYSYNTDYDFISLHTEFTPIRYEIGQLDFSGSLMLGAVNTGNDSYGDNNTNLFYGAAAALNINNQIGFSIDTKVSRFINSWTSVSMIGYY